MKRKKHDDGAKKKREQLFLDNENIIDGICFIYVFVCDLWSRIIYEQRQRPHLKNLNQ